MLGFGICFPPHPLSMWIWKGKLTEPSASVCAHLAPSLSPQVILKDLELLAEIASSPAGQTEEGHSVSDGSDVQPGPVELHVPARAGQLSSSSECHSSVPPCSWALSTFQGTSQVCSGKRRSFFYSNKSMPSSPPSIVWGSSLPWRRPGCCFYFYYSFP